MKALLIYPLFPKSFWSFDKAIELAGRKAILPPLGLVTVAGILPDEWDLRLVDRNVEDLTEADWDWAELVIFSGMIVQKPDMLAQIREAKRRNIPVAVGGPYATALPHEVIEAGADFRVLDEGEITLPMLVEAIEKGETEGTFRALERPDVSTSPVPRFDLLKLDAYSEMAVQFSRGCPFQCEFCDIIVLYGRKPRTKSPEQMLAELQYLYDLGWRRSIFMVDDNFIGNKRNVKLMLKALVPWMKEKGYPFTFSTEASVDLAQDQEMMDLMTACNFGAVFLGVETPDEESLALTQKFQNNRDPLSESIHKIASTGIRVMAGFIIGFDGEKKGAGDRIVQFVEKCSVPTALFSMLQALPDTALWHRLEKENRLLAGKETANIHQTTLMNFVPTRPVEDVAQEYVDAFWNLYDPQKYLDRCYRHYRILGEAPCHNDKSRGPKPKSAKEPFNWHLVKALAIVCWKQGVERETRSTFWKYLFEMFKHNRGGVGSYLTVCAQIEHFLEYRQIVKDEIESQIAEVIATREEAPEMVATAS